MKTTFSRLFSMIAALLMLCLLITGVAFRFLMMSWVESEKRKSLSADASALADLAEAYDSAGELESNWNFQIGLSLFSEVGEVSAMICDEDGYVVICSCDNLTCDHVGKQVPESYRREMLREGVYYEKNVRLADIYDDARFLAGQAVVNDQTGNLVGFVVVTAPMNQTTDYMLRSSTFFIYTAIGALGLALVAATFLSRSLVRPLGQMADVARRFGYGETKLRAEQTKSNTREVNDLALAFNTMADSLEQSEQRRQEFIANVSHELKTPIALIQGYAEGLVEGMAEDKENRDYYCGVIMDEAGKMNRMVRQLLTLTALEFGGERLSVERFDLTELIASVISSSGVLLKQNELTVDFDGKEPVYVMGDEFKIEEVITNYLTNAIHHVGGGEKKIQIRIDHRRDGKEVCVEVFNTGNPIPDEALPNLWTKFYKVDKARTREYGGSGIGLSIVKAIMEMHHKACGVKNHENGVEFWFTLDTAGENKILPETES